jgi:hypothetical protein
MRDHFIDILGYLVGGLSLPILAQLSKVNEAKGKHGRIVGRFT